MSPCDDFRTTWSIFIGCMVTIGPCIWVVMHPNVLHLNFVEGTKEKDRKTTDI